MLAGEYNRRDAVDGTDIMGAGSLLSELLEKLPVLFDEPLREFASVTPIPILRDIRCHTCRLLVYCNGRCGGFDLIPGLETNTVGRWR